MVLIEDQPYRIFRTSILRGDVSGKFRISGYWGYEFTLPSEDEYGERRGKLKLRLEVPMEKFEEETASEIIHFGQETESKIFPISEPKKLRTALITWILTRST